jgi:hypothetical protein
MTTEKKIPAMLLLLGLGENKTPGKLTAPLTSPANLLS